MEVLHAVKYCELACHAVACPVCCYDLRGGPHGRERCPECGYVLELLQPSQSPTCGGGPSRYNIAQILMQCLRSVLGDWSGRKRWSSCSPYHKCDPLELCIKTAIVAACTGLYPLALLLVEVHEVELSRDRVAAEYAVEVRNSISDSSTAAIEAEFDSIDNFVRSRTTRPWWTWIGSLEAAFYSAPYIRAVTFVILVWVALFLSSRWAVHRNGIQYNWMHSFRGVVGCADTLGALGWIGSPLIVCVYWRWSIEVATRASAVLLLAVGLIVVARHACFRLRYLHADKGWIAVIGLQTLAFAAMATIVAMDTNL